jgi:hypothetical protein
VVLPTPPLKDVTITALPKQLTPILKIIQQMQVNYIKENQICQSKIKMKIIFYRIL